MSRAGPSRYSLCSYLKPGKSQLKMRNLVEESLLQSVSQVPQLGKQLPRVLSFACTEPTIVFQALESSLSLFQPPSASLT